MHILLLVFDAMTGCCWSSPFVCKRSSWYSESELTSEAMYRYHFDPGRASLSAISDSDSDDLVPHLSLRLCHSTGPRSRDRTSAQGARGPSISPFRYTTPTQSDNLQLFDWTAEGDRPLRDHRRRAERRPRVSPPVSFSDERRESLFRVMTFRTLPTTDR
jgi:hypothetical protein